MSHQDSTPTNRSGYVKVALFGKSYTCKLEYARYGNNRLAIQLVDPDDGDLIATVTTNLHDQPLEDGQVFVKTWSENEGILPQLVRQGIFEVVGSAPAGYATAAICKLLRPWPVE